MKKLLLFGAISFGLNALGQTNLRYNIDEIRLDSTEMIAYIIDTGEPVTGIVLSYYEGGTIEAEGEFHNGEIILSKRYYPNGKLFEKANLVDSTHSMFYPDGSLMIESSNSLDYIAYNPIGNEIDSDLLANSVFTHDTNFEENPKPEIVTVKKTNKPFTGLLIKYYDNGMPWFNQCYKNGVLHGYAVAWHENGEIMYTTNYIDGKENGIQRQFYSNGQMRSESEYKDHVPHGFQKIWFEDGTLKAENNFLNGEPHGSVKLHNAAGKLIKHGTFENGVLVSEDCFENGKKVVCE